MKKIKLPIISGKSTAKIFKKVMLGVLCCVSIGSIAGCNFSSREEYLAKSNQSDEEQSEAMMQSIMDALEAQDADSIKAMFSTYAVENTENLDEKIDELIAFYPGCDGGFEGMYDTEESTNYGVESKVLNGTYTVTNNNEKYYMIFTIQVENDEEPEKIGLHLIEVMPYDEMPDGFKRKGQDDAPGIYVSE